MLMVGIDEAGYGPILGPLVISAVGFRLPDAISELSLWQLLSASVTAKPRKSAIKLVITDSKKVYSKRSDLRNLERSALSAVWAATDGHPSSFESLLDAISLQAKPHLDNKWYCDRNLELPHAADANELRIAGRLFVEDLRDVNGKLAVVKTIPLVETRFNHLIGQMRNKSSVLFSQTVRLIDAVIRSASEPRIDIYIDKQGGKIRYLNDLLRSFGPSADLKVLGERADDSGYRLRFQGKTVTLRFLAGGEMHRMAIALASIVSKYMRELFMLQFNRYWQRLYPDIKPTAGYWTDGKRFLAYLAGHADERHVPTHLLVRRA